MSCNREEKKRYANERDTTTVETKLGKREKEENSRKRERREGRKRYNVHRDKL